MYKFYPPFAKVTHLPFTVVTHMDIYTMNTDGPFCILRQVPCLLRV